MLRSEGEMNLDNLVFQPDGTVTNGQYGEVLAHFSDDGTVRANGPYGAVLGFIENDGTIKQGGPYGAVLGFVEPDGTIKQGGPYGQTVSTVGPPMHKNAALLLLFG